MGRVTFYCVTLTTRRSTQRDKCSSMELKKRHKAVKLLSFPLLWRFQVGWYNSVLAPSLHLSYPDDILAVVVLSTPAMFERAFLPFLEERGCQGLSDPIDLCVRFCVSSAVSQVRLTFCRWWQLFRQTDRDKVWRFIRDAFTYTTKSFLYCALFGD